MFHLGHLANQGKKEATSELEFYAAVALVAHFKEMPEIHIKRTFYKRRSCHIVEHAYPHEIAVLVS